MIDPRRLRVLQALAEHGTVTAASAALYMSPSAMSQQLAALEHEVGYSLIARRGRRVILTATGRVLVAHAIRMGELLEEAESDLAACESGEVGDVTIAAFSTAITEIVAEVVVTLRDRTPRLQIHVKDAEGPIGQRLVVNGEADIAVAVAVAHQDNTIPGIETLRRRQLYAEPFDAIVPGDHVCADMEFITLAQLGEDPWITPWPGNPIRDLVFSACEEAGFRPRVESLSDDFRAVCALVSAGAGVALVPRSALRGANIQNAVVLPISGRSRPARRVFVAARRGSEGHPLIRTVLSVIEEYARKLQNTGDVGWSQGSSF